MATPPLRRVKTYTAGSGYVYQYYFVGQRAALPSAPEAPATEFIFDVTSDRKTMFAISVFLQPSALDAWSAAHGRPLSSSEQYAAAKLRLLRGFDEVERLHSRVALTVNGGNVEELLADLQLD
jgi:hypothetical protein